MFLKQTSSSRRPIEPARFVFLPFRKSTQKNEKHKIISRLQSLKGYQLARQKTKKNYGRDKAYGEKIQDNTRKETHPC